MTHPNWRRVGRAAPCPVCGKPDWCAVSSDKSAALCQRVESDRRVGDAGWLHRLRDDARTARRRTVRSFRVRPSITIDQSRLTALADQYRASVDPNRFRQLGISLGLTIENLGRLTCGWSAEHSAWSFPMRDATGNVLGIRLRRENGFKFAVTGSKEGLFVPSDCDSTSHRLFVSEGPTDTAALLDMGIGNVVGRPSCTGGLKLLVDLVRRRKPAEVIVVADADTPGLLGAANLASVLVAYVPAVRTIAPPEGIKDTRQWLRAGAGHHDVSAVVDAAPIRRLAVRAR